MAQAGVFSDPNDIKWTWIGEGKKGEDNDKIYYKAAQVVRISDGSMRQFKLGDTVYVANEVGEEAWVAHVVEFFENGTADDDVELIDDSNPLNSMRCTLRWLYNRGDIDKESIRLNPDIPRSVPGEVYFSDHVERPGSNGLEVIEGRAFLCATRADMSNLRDNPPKNYWRGDVIRLVRCFYGTNNGTPHPIRELDRGELKYLLDHPSTDTHLYRKSRAALYGVTGAVMKGTGRKKRPLSGSSSVREYDSDGSGGHAMRKSPGRAKDHADNFDMDDVSVPLPGSQKHYSRTGSSSKRDEDFVQKSERRASRGKTRIPFVPESEDNVQPTSNRVIETIEKSGNVRSGRGAIKHQSPKKPVKKGESRVQKNNHPRAKGVDAESNNVMKSPEMKESLQKLGESLKTVPPEELPFVFNNLRKMLNLMTGTMAEKDLTFNMGEQDRNAVAQVVAQQMFGSSLARGGGGASSAHNNSSRPVIPKRTKGRE